MGALDHLVKEHDLQRTVLEHLRLRRRHNVWWFAIPNAGKRSRWAAGRLKAEGMTAGVSDLCIMLPKSCAWLELKTTKGTQTEEQKSFQAVCERLGQPYCLARTIDEAIAFLKQVGAL